MGKENTALTEYLKGKEERDEREREREREEKMRDSQMVLIF
jgi:hypothetical protein